MNETGAFPLFRNRPASSVRAFVVATTADIGESIICPVCLDVFEGRILQCHAGHSVCGSCHKKLSACPTCRGGFASKMRNYALEEVIFSLMKCGLTDSGWLKTAQSSSQNASQIRRRQCHQGLIIGGLSANRQPSGLFTCHADPACQARLPICRLLNHVRQLHEPSFCTSNANLFEIPPDGISLSREQRIAINNTIAFQMRLTLSLHRSVRRAVHIRRAGVFFICFDALPNTSSAVSDLPTHYAWVQMAGTAYEATRYKFCCELQYICGSNSGGAGCQRLVTATYSDSVLGEGCLHKNIQAKRNCLVVCVPTQLAKATLRVMIYAEHLASSSAIPPQAGRRGTKTKVIERALEKQPRNVATTGRFQGESTPDA